MKNLKKIFSAEKCLDSLFLNLLGIQVFRYLIAKLFYFIKSLFIKSNNFEGVKKKGYLKIENFLKKHEFDEIKKEFESAIKDERFSKRVSQGTDEVIDEGLEYISLILTDEIKDIYPKLYELKENTFIKKYFYECEQKKNFQIHARIEKIIITDKDKTDPNKEYHCDTFHNTFKAFLYIDNVSNSDGPFTIVPGSHKLSFNRIFFEWRMSILYSIKKFNSSFRSTKSKKDIDEQSINFPLKENTFLMANTHAIHRRGDAENNSQRMAIQFWVRDNPFKIFL